MRPADADRVRDAFGPATYLEMILNNWTSDVERVVKVMEALIKDKKQPQADRDLAEKKALPAAKALQKSLKAAAPAMTGLLGELADAKLAKHADAQTFLLSVGAGAMVLASEVLTTLGKLDEITQKTGPKNGRFLGHEGKMLALFTPMKNFQAELAKMKSASDALRTPLAPDRPAAPTPARPVGRPAPLAKPAVAPAAAVKAAAPAPAPAPAPKKAAKPLPTPPQRKA